MPLIRKGPDKDPSSQPKPDAAVLLATGNEDERWAAARQLALAPKNAPLLGEALAREKSARVREALFTALAQIGTDETAQIVLPYLQQADAAIRTQSLDALCAMPQAVLPHLPALFTSTDRDVRLLACEIVRHLPAPTATEILCQLLDGEADVNVCAAAVEVLAEAGQPAALPVLAACARRFAGVDFLVFAIDIAANRIRGGAPDARPA
jgi:HEAT repeat protein